MSRNHAFDFIKGFGLLLIAGLHINLFLGINDTAVFVFNTVMRFAVPFFFVASGYLLFKKLKKCENAKPILSAYIQRIAQYYIIGLCVCFLFDYFITRPILNPPYFFRSSINYLSGFTSGNFFGDFIYYGLGVPSGIHLWFLIAMVWSAVAIFIFCYKNPANIKTLTGISLLFYILGLFGISQPYSHIAALPFYPRDAVFFGLFYLCLGGYWAMYGLNIKKFIPGKWLFPAVLFFSGLQLAERAGILFAFDVPRSDWGEYFLTTIPLTIMLFQYALENGNRFANNWFTRVGENSIGVYILHMPVIRIIRIFTDKVIEVPWLWQTLWFQLVVPVITIAVTYCLYMFFLKFKNMLFKKEAHVLNA